MTLETGLVALKMMMGEEVKRFTHLKNYHILVNLSRCALLKYIESQANAQFDQEVVKKFFELRENDPDFL
jgi:hypothetical protein